MKTLTLIHGTKGGVGKSMTASLLTNYMIDKNMSPTILESDGTAPDVGMRFGGICNAISAPITDSDSIYDALDALEVESAQHVIVNLPANAEALDNIADEIAAVVASLGYDMKTVFMIGEGINSARLASKSLEDGLVSYSTNAIAVMNGRFGRSTDKFAWFASDERNIWLQQYKEFYMPELSRRVIESPIYEEQVTFSHIASIKSDTTTSNRMLMQKFLVGCEPICKAITGATDE